MIIDELFEAPQQCPECGGISFSNLILAEKKDACYHKVKASAKVWPSAYASGRLVQCRKKGAANYGNKSEGVMEMDKSQTPPGRDGSNNPDAGKKEYTAKATTPEKVAKHGVKILNKIFNKKKGVAEEYDPYEPEAYDEFVSDTYSDDNPEDEQGVAEGIQQQYLWHGSRQKIDMLEPRQSVDTGGAAGSNQNAIYATSDPKVAIAMGLTTPGSDTGMFPNDPQMVLFKGKIRKGEYVYLHKLPFNGPDGKPQFVQGGNTREFHSIPGVTGIKPVKIKKVSVNDYMNLIRLATKKDLYLRKKYMKQGVAENAVPQLSVPQLAAISDEALDKAYGYGRSTPGNTFGWQANLASAAYAKQAIDKGATDLIAISDAVHKGWWSVAQKFVDNPDQFSDTEKLRADGKFDKKMADRKAQMVPFKQLTKDQQDIDTVVARALLQAIRGPQQPGSNGQPSVEEGYVPINIYKGPTNPAPKPKKVEPEHKYVDNQVETEKYYQDREKYFYNVVGKFDGKVINPQPIKGLRAAEEFMKQNGLGGGNADIEQISTIRFHATGIDASGKRVVSEPLTDMKDVRNFYKQHGIDQFASTTDLTTTDDGSVTEGQLELNTPDPVVVVQDLKGKILDKINLSVAAQKYKLGPPQNIKTQLAHQNYTKVGNYMIVSPMSGQPQDQTTTGQKQAFTATEGEQQPGADYRDPKEVDYDDEYDAMVARVKKLAGLGPMKTVYDPARRQYRNMPTAQQPKK